MSNIPTDKWGVQQLVTDYSSWGASDDVNAIPKPGIGVKPTDITKPSNWTTPVVGSSGGKAAQKAPEFVRFRTGVDYGSGIVDTASSTKWWEGDFVISAGATFVTNPFVGMWDTTSFKPDPMFDTRAYIAELHKKGYSTDDAMVEALRETSSKEEADYVLDTRRDLAIAEKAQGLSTTGTIAAGVLPSLVLGGVFGLAGATAGLTGTTLAVTAGAGEAIVEGGTALLADSNNQYNADWTDAIGIGFVGTGIAVRALKGSKSGSKAASKAVDDVVDDVADATVEPTTKSSYRYRQDNPVVGGVLYKQYKNGNIKMNGVDIPFEDTVVSGGKVDVDAKPSWKPVDVESVSGYSVLGTKPISSELEDALTDVERAARVEVKPTPKPKDDAKVEAKVKENKAKLKEYSSTVAKLEKQIASKEKAKSKSYSQSAIDKLNAEIKELKPDLAKARKNMKRAEERLGIVKEVVKVVKDIKEYEKAVGRAKGVIESLSKKDVTQEDVKKALAKAESILRDKEKALAKALDNKS